MNGGNVNGREQRERRTGPLRPGRVATVLFVVAASALFAKEYATGAEDAFSDWVLFWTGSPIGLGFLAVVAAAFVLDGVLRVAVALAGPDRSVTAVEAMDASARIPRREPSELREWLQRHRFRPEETEGGAILGIRGRFSFIPGFVARAGVVVLGVGLVVSSRGREVESVRLRVGDEAVLFGRGIVLTSVDTVLPDRVLRMGTEARFRLQGLGGTARVGGSDVRLAHYPPRKLGGVWYRLDAVGFGPELMLAKGGREERLAPMLAALPPGTAETVRSRLIGPLKIELEPEETIRKGRLEGRWYNLATPAYRVFPEGSETGVAVAPGASAMVGGAELFIAPGTRAWLQVDAVRDPGLAAVRWGLLILGAGLAALLSRPFWYARKVAFVPVPGEEFLLFGYEEEFFKKWAQYRFHEWKRDFLPAAEPTSVIADLEKTVDAGSAPADAEGGDSG